MGIYSPDTQAGDIIVELFGSAVPFVICPVRNGDDFEGGDWGFEGHEELRDWLSQLIGECYVHERMTKAFFEENADKLGDIKIFHLCWLRLSLRTSNGILISISRDRKAANEL